MHRYSAPRTGLTLVETVVVIAIIGVLVGMVSVGVLAARESARKLQCQSQTHQVGIGVHDFLATHKQLPNSLDKIKVLGRQSTVPPLHVEPGPWIQVVSAVEGSIARYEDCLYGSGIIGPGNGTECDQPAWGHCPSEPVQKCLSYRFCSGSNGSQYSIDAAFAANGTFAIGLKRSAADISDGLSNTLAVTERVGSDVGSRPFASVYQASNRGNPVAPSDIVQFCNRNWQSRVEHTGCGCPGAWAYLQVYVNTLLPPNPGAIECVVDVPFTCISASSYHSRGCNSLMLDGSVRFISDGIDLKTWHSTGAVSDGFPSAID